jgi:heat shock protein HtpX
MFKRIFLFMAVNILVMTTVSIVLSVLGVGNYITEAGLDYNALFVICFVWGMAGSFISLLMSKFMAKRMMGLQIIEGHGTYSSILQTVHRLAKQAGIEKMPEVGVYDSADINAFATGATKNSSLVAVSTGLLQKMTDDEVEAVLAHEISHVANGDMITLALVQGVVNAFVMFFARVAAFAIDQAMRGDDDEGGGLGYFAHMMVVMVLQIAFGILAMPIVSYFSRYREYRADRGAAKLAGREKMIQALQRLQSNYETMAESKVESNMKAMQISSKSSWLALISTHPPLEARIRALQGRSI